MTRVAVRPGMLRWACERARQLSGGATAVTQLTDDTLRDELIPYRTADDAVRVEARYESKTFWLDQRCIAELFGVDVRTVSYHLKEVYASEELTPETTLQQIWRVQHEAAIIPEGT